MYEARDLRRRLVVVHAFHGVPVPALDGFDLPLPVLFRADGVVVVDDGDRPLLLRPEKQAL